MKNSLLTSKKIKCIIFNLDELVQSTGVKDLLMNLGLPYAVVSIKAKTNMEQLLRIAGLHIFFTEDRIFSSEQLSGSTPGFHIFFHAVRSMGFEPSECAVVDKSDVGLNLARKEDFCVFGMNDGSNSIELENKGVLAFSEFGDLAEFIELFNEEADLEIKRQQN